MSAIILDCGLRVVATSARATPRHGQQSNLLRARGVRRWGSGGVGAFNRGLTRAAAHGGDLQGTEQESIRQQLEQIFNRSKDEVETAAGAAALADDEGDRSYGWLPEPSVEEVLADPEGPMAHMPVLEAPTARLPGFQETVLVTNPHEVHMVTELARQPRPWMYAHFQLLQGGAERPGATTAECGTEAGGCSGSVHPGRVGCLVVIDAFYTRPDGSMVLSTSSMGAVEVCGGATVQSVPYVKASCRLVSDKEDAACLGAEGGAARLEVQHTVAKLLHLEVQVWGMYDDWRRLMSRAGQRAASITADRQLAAWRPDWLTAPAPTRFGGDAPVLRGADSVEDACVDDNGAMLESTLNRTRALSFSLAGIVPQLAGAEERQQLLAEPSIVRRLEMTRQLLQRRMRFLAACTAVASISLD